VTERQVRMALHRLCSDAMVAGSYHPEGCQRCESPCKYGTSLLRHFGWQRSAPKETPGEKTSMVGSDRVRRYVRGYNKQSIVRR